MANAICIACACDEDHGCPTSLVQIEGQHTCFWLYFDAAKKVGLCSECGDFIHSWKHGQREPMLALISVRFYRQLMFICESREAALTWLATPHEFLRGRTPRELIIHGHLEEVQTILDQLRSGAFA